MVESFVFVVANTYYLVLKTDTVDEKLYNQREIYL